MNALRTIVRDLVDRRLWPAAALLAIALVALPVLLRSSDASAPAAAVTAAPAGTTVKLPAKLARFTQLPRYAGRKTSGAVPDPFVNPKGAAAASAATSASGGEGETPEITPLAGPVSSGAGMSTPAASPSPAASTGSPAGATTATAAPRTPEALPATPASERGTTYEIFHVDVRYGSGDDAITLRDAPRLALLPDERRPVAALVGVETGGERAAFVVRTDAVPAGAEGCEPSRRACQYVALAAGQHVDLEIVGEDGKIARERLEVLSIRRTTTRSTAAAKRAYKRTSAAGRCLLGAISADAFDPATGTVSKPRAATCARVARAAGGPAVLSLR